MSMHKQTDCRQQDKLANLISKSEKISLSEHRVSLPKYIYKLNVERIIYFCGAYQWRE